MKRITSFDANVRVTKSGIRRVLLALLGAVALLGATKTQAQTPATYAFTLSWTNTDSSVITNLIESSVDGTTFIQIAQLDPSLASYTDSTLPAATIYYYRMRSQNTTGYSVYSDVVTAMAPPELSIDSPADYQGVADAASVITGTAIGVNGIASVTVNGQAVSLTGNNWSASVALALGTNAFTVIATDNNSAATVESVHIILDTPPVANFTTTTTAGTAPLLVNFSNLTSGIVTNYFWDFGDGTTSTLATPSHTYALAGSYAVSLVAYGPGGVSTANLPGVITVSNALVDTAPPTLTIVSPADYQTVNNASLTVTGTALDASGVQSVTVNGTKATFNGNAWSVTITLASGLNTLSIVATDNSPNQNAVTQIIHVTDTPAPVAGFSATPVSGPAPLAVNFSDEAIGIVTNLFWNFGDGTTSTWSNPSHTYTAAGSYAVSLTVSGPGGTATLNRPAYITVTGASTNTVTGTTPPTLTIATPVDYQLVANNSVTISGSASDASGIQSVTVNGQAATLSGNNWSTTATLANGTNTLIVIATDSSANQNTTTQIVHVVVGTAPVANFTGTPTTGTAPLLVNFTDASTGTIATRSWNFGDGGTSTLLNPTHSYANAGTYSVSLTVSGALGSVTFNRANFITVTNATPVADTTAPTLSIATPADYQLVASSSVTVSGSASDASGIQSVTVNGQAATLSGNNWSTTAALANGTNTLIVIATDSSANQNTTTQIVHAVVGVAPVANFSGTPTTGAAPLLVNFTDASTGTIATRSWNFGDGGTSTLVNPIHSYANTGTYSVSLTVSGALGSVTFNRANFITVTNANPVADTTPPTLTIVTPTDYQLAASSSVTVSGSASDASGIQSVTVNGQAASLNGNNWSTTTALANGTNTLIVIATDSSANQNTATQIVHTVVGAAPVANFSGTPTTGAAPLLVNFTDASAGTIATRSWNFGDGGTSTLVNPTHSYANTGTYSVSLTVSGSLGSVTFNRASFITVTNFTGDSTAPTLTIVTPTDYQLVTSSSLTISGTATDDSGIQSVTVNSQAAPLNGNNWSMPVTLVNGTNTFTVTATDSSANHNNVAQLIHVILGAAPVASFTAAPTAGAAPLLVNFTDASTGNIATRSWNFGDGSTSALVNPAHSYTNAGTYSVSLTVSGALGSVTFNRASFITVTNVNSVADTTPPTLTIVTPTDYQLAVSSSLIVSGTASDASGVQSVTVNGQAATLSGNGWSATVALIAGTNTLTVVATDSSANQNTATQIVHAVLPAAPVANFTGTPTTGAAPLPVTFNDTSAGYVTSRVWNFGDGSTSTQASPTHTYANSGIYAVTLSVTGPGGPGILSRGNFVTVTNNVVAQNNTTGPGLAVASPSDYQVFSKDVINIAGTASSASGIQSVTVNGQAAALNGSAWNAPLTLALGTNTFTVVATDASPLANTATLTVHAVLSLPTGSALTNYLPQIVAAPSVTNAMSTVGNVNVIVAGEPVDFTVQAIDPLGGTLTYEWNFGDNQTDPDVGPEHTYSSTNCQGYAVQVIISNEIGSTTGTVQVATACSLNVAKMELFSNLTTTDADHFTATATVDLNTGFTPAGQTLAVDVGGAQVSFQMDSKGNGVSSYGKTQLTFNKKTGLWTLTASLKNGEWHDQWLNYGLVTGTPLTGSAAAAVPAIVVVGNEAFVAQPTMASVATKSKLGLTHVTSRSSAARSQVAP